MWARVRSSFWSGVWSPVKSILKMVALKVMAVIASFSTKLAVPKEAGLGAPVEVVGVVGGTSCELVRVADKMTTACAPPMTDNAISGANRAVRSSMAGVPSSVARDAWRHLSVPPHGRQLNQ